jgi:hypothetical protein
MMAHIVLDGNMVGKKISTLNFKSYCTHFNCLATRHRNGDWTIHSDDAINFFWLGANMNLVSSSTLTESVSEKYLRR